MFSSLTSYPPKKHLVRQWKENWVDLQRSDYYHTGSSMACWTYEAQSYTGGNKLTFLNIPGWRLWLVSQGFYRYIMNSDYFLQQRWTNLFNFKYLGTQLNVTQRTHCISPLPPVFPPCVTGVFMPGVLRSSQWHNLFNYRSSYVWYISSCSTRSSRTTTIIYYYYWYYSWGLKCRAPATGTIYSITDLIFTGNSCSMN